MDPGWTNERQIMVHLTPRMQRLNTGSTPNCMGLRARGKRYAYFVSSRAAFVRRDSSSVFDSRKMEPLSPARRRPRPARKIPTLSSDSIFSLRNDRCGECIIRDSPFQITSAYPNLRYLAADSSGRDGHALRRWATGPTGTGGTATPGRVSPARIPGEGSWKENGAS